MSNVNLKHERLLKIILAPYISEKATFLGEKNNQAIFRVANDATKKEIKSAIELLWKEQKIEISTVRTINVRSDWKKAIVSIKDGKELSFTNFTNSEAK